MGNYNSTRWTGHRRRRLVTEAVALRVRDFRAALRGTAPPAGSLHWQGPGWAGPCSMGWGLGPREAGARRAFVLRYAVEQPGAAPEPVTLTVMLEAVPAPLGGVRWWFRCPGCARPRGALYLVPGSPRPRCRVCCRLGYRSQLLVGEWRLDHRMMRLHARMGSFPEYAKRDVCPAKPPRMHWRTYARRWAQFEAVRGAWEAKVEASLARFLERIGAW